MHALIEIFFGTCLCVSIAVLTFTISGSAREIVEALENLSDPVDDVETIGSAYAPNVYDDEAQDGTYVTCGGCGRTVMTEIDGFTAVPHNCDALASRFEGKLFGQAIDAAKK